MKVFNDTETIVLNSLNLDLHDACISVGDDGQWMQVSDIVIDVPSEQATFHLPTRLSVGKTAKLKVCFDGRLSYTIAGYFLASWKDAEETKYYTVSEFAVFAFPVPSR